MSDLNDSSAGNPILQFLSSGIRHVQALAQLAIEESKEAGALYVRLFIYLLFAVLVAAFGYAFLIIFVAFAAATFLGWSWVWILLGLAVTHFIFAAFALWRVRTCFRTPVFPATIEEVQRDSKLLGQVKKPDITPIEQSQP
ncbi:MAG: phage holin family protein [Chthoniobacterales bacterium]